MWQTAPKVPTLATNRVHVWFADFKIIENSLALEQTLSASELARTGAFLNGEARRDFIAARGILRVLLGAYLNEEPWRVELTVGERRKPRLASGRIRFNTSHSHGLALFAFALDAEVGIDLEKIDPSTLESVTSTQILTESEKRNVLLSGPQERPTLLGCLWTRKEAYAKCLGDGLHHDLQQVEVGATSDRTRIGNVTLLSLPSPQGFSAALAFAGELRDLSLWKWHPERRTSPDQYPTVKPRLLRAN